MRILPRTQRGHPTAVRHHALSTLTPRPFTLCTLKGKAMAAPGKRDTSGTSKRKPVPQPATQSQSPSPNPSAPNSPAPKRELTSTIIPNVYLAGALLAALSLSWPLRWAISGAPILVYAILLGEAYGHRILPFVPLWTIFASVNFVYAVCATSWLLY
jgi:hypothetical protein